MSTSEGKGKKSTDAAASASSSSADGDTGRTKADRTKADKTKADKTKAGTTKAGATKAGATKAGATKAGASAAGDAEERAERTTRRGDRPEKLPDGPSSTLYKVVMFGLMILGLVWIVTFYLMNADGPIPPLGTWNLVVGFLSIMVGFGMTTRWR